MASRPTDVGAYLRSRLGTGSNTADDAVSWRVRSRKPVRSDRRIVGTDDTRRKPVYGRMYQTPFADRIATRSVSPRWRWADLRADHVNSILMAGRAGPVCARAGPHLADPYWALHAAPALGYGEVEWPCIPLGQGAARAHLRRAVQLAAERPEANG